MCRSKRQWLAAFCLFAAVATPLRADAPQRETAVANFVATPLIIAHRGASHDAPENTLAAFHLAWEMGADGIEGDFYLTKDCRIVCIHDRTTKRTAGVELDVKASTFAALRRLDVGRHKDQKYAGEVIPTLEEVLATVPSGKRIFIEVKCGPEIVPHLQKVLAQSRLKPNQTYVIAFDEDVVTASKKAMPQVKAYWVTGFREKEDDGTWHPNVDEVLATVRRCHADGVDVKADRGIVDAEFARRLRDAGLEFHCWTVNERAEAEHFRQLGVDSITTDRPDHTSSFHGNR